MLDQVNIGEPGADGAMRVTLGNAELSFNARRDGDEIVVSGPQEGREPARAMMLWPKPEQLPGTIRALTEIAYNNWSARMGGAGGREKG